MQDAGRQLETTRATLQAAQAAERAMLARATAAEDRVRELDVRCSDMEQETLHATYVKECVVLNTGTNLAVCLVPLVCLCLVLSAE